MTAKKMFPYILAAFLTTAAFAPARSEVIDKIAIIVNGEIITQSEIDRMLFPLFQQYRTMYQGGELESKIEEARQKIVQQLIEDRLILCEAKKLNMEVLDKEVEEKIEETADSRFGSRAAFEAAMAEQRVTMKELKERYRDQIMTRRLVDQKIGSKIVVTPVELNDYYNKRSAEFVHPEMVKLRNILLKPKEGVSASKTADLAKEISRRLRSGGDFAELARIYSDGPGADEGGLMGYSKKGDLLPEIEKVVFNMKEGEVSDMIQTGLGYHIFKMEERVQQKVLPLESVRRDIEELIYRDKVKDKLKGWIEGLKKNAYIAFK